MVHHSCDVCGKTLNAETERRYEVILEVRPSPAPPLEPHCGSPFHDDLDPLEILEELIISEESMPSYEVEIEQPCRLKYDLCLECRKRFLTDPFGRKTRTDIHFSAN